MWSVIFLDKRFHLWSFMSDIQASVAVFRHWPYVMFGVMRGNIVEGCTTKSLQPHLGHGYCCCQEERSKTVFSRWLAGSKLAAKTAQEYPRAVWEQNQDLAREDMDHTTNHVCPKYFRITRVTRMAYSPRLWQNTLGQKERTFLLVARSLVAGKEANTLAPTSSHGTTNSLTWNALSKWRLWAWLPTVTEFA